MLEISSVALPCFGFSIDGGVVKYTIALDIPKQWFVPGRTYISRDMGALGLAEKIEELMTGPNVYHLCAIAGAKLYVDADAVKGGTEAIDALRADVPQLAYVGPYTGANAPIAVSASGYCGSKVNYKTYTKDGKSGAVYKGPIAVESFKVGGEYEKLWADWSIFEGSPGCQGAEKLSTALKEKKSIAGIRVRGTALRKNSFTTDDDKNVSRLEISASWIETVYYYPPKPTDGGFSAVPPAAPPATTAPPPIAPPPQSGQPHFAPPIDSGDIPF